MRILHTADWHLGDRLGRIDRTADLRQAVERVGAFCQEHDADVLLVAGDLFSELSRPDSLRESIEHMGKTFLPFVRRGGTVLAITGNHDNETFCQTLRHTMQLAAPADAADGEEVPPGRFYLASEPGWLRLRDGDGVMVQFVLLPYPTPTRYLEEGSRRYASLEDKNRRLHEACVRWLQHLRGSSRFDQALPTVLAAHLHVQGAVLPNLFRISEQESIVFGPKDLPVDWDYVALGHIHQPQALGGLTHVRYAGSVERLDLGEWKDDKGVVLVDVGPEGLRAAPRVLPLPARPMYDVAIQNPAAEVPGLRVRYPRAAEALVRYHVTYEAGKDVLNDVLAELDAVFPHWYHREWSEAGEQAWPPAPIESAAESVRGTVLDYLGRQLDGHRDRGDVLRLAEELLQESEAG